MSHEPLHHIADPTALTGLAARARQEALPRIEIADGAAFVAARLERSRRYTRAQALAILFRRVGEIAAERRRCGEEPA
jgi:hypothetical protein